LVRIDRVADRGPDLPAFVHGRQRLYRHFQNIRNFCRALLTVDLIFDRRLLRSEIIADQRHERRHRAAGPGETALSRLARAAPAQRHLVASAAQQKRDARAAAAQRRLVAAAAQQDDWIWRWLKRQYEDALAAPLSPRLATLIAQLETQDVSA